MKETARKIMCHTESDEMNVKRIARYLKGAPTAKCLIEINNFLPFVNVYTDSDWARQNQTCKSTSGGVTQWGSMTLSAWSRKLQSVSLSSAEAESYALTPGIHERMVTKRLLKELGYEVTFVNHVDSQSVKAWASKRGLGRMKHVMLKVHVRARRRGKEANDTCPREHEFEQSRPDDKMSYIRSAHERMRNVGSETQQRRRENPSETSYSNVRSRQRCPDLKGECAESPTFSATNFSVE